MTLKAPQIRPATFTFGARKISREVPLMSELVMLSEAVSKTFLPNAWKKLWINIIDILKDIVVIVDDWRLKFLNNLLEDMYALHYTVYKDSYQTFEEILCYSLIPKLFHHVEKVKVSGIEDLHGVYAAVDAVLHVCNIAVENKFYDEFSLIMTKKEVSFKKYFELTGCWLFQQMCILSYGFVPSERKFFRDSFFQFFRLYMEFKLKSESMQKNITDISQLFNKFLNNYKSYLSLVKKSQVKTELIMTLNQIRGIHLPDNKIYSIQILSLVTEKFPEMTETEALNLLEILNNNINCLTENDFCISLMDELAQELQAKNNGCFNSNFIVEETKSHLENIKHNDTKEVTSTDYSLETFNLEDKKLQERLLQRQITAPNGDADISHYYKELVSNESIELDKYLVHLLHADFLMDNSEENKENDIYNWCENIVNKVKESKYNTKKIKDLEKENLSKTSIITSHNVNKIKRTAANREIFVDNIKITLPKNVSYSKERLSCSFKKKIFKIRTKKIGLINAFKLVCEKLEKFKSCENNLN